MTSKNLTLVKTVGRSICVAMGFALWGCAAPDRVVYRNYTQIRTQLHTQDDVEAILGEPDQKLGDRWMYERPDQHLIVFVEFDEKGRVTRTQWVDALSESWDDTDEKR